jgi:hypothetical protein
MNIEKARRKKLEEEKEQDENQQNNSFTKVKPIHKVMSRVELEEIICRFNQRERDRNEKINREKMDCLKAKLMGSRGKPTLTKNT